MMAKGVAKAGEIAKTQTKAVAERMVPTWDEETPFLSINT